MWRKMSNGLKCRNSWQEIILMFNFWKIMKQRYFINVGFSDTNTEIDGIFYSNN